MGVCNLSLEQHCPLFLLLKEKAAFIALLFGFLFLLNWLKMQGFEFDQWRKKNI